jgi:hypothetical protein
MTRKHIGALGVIAVLVGLVAIAATVGRGSVVRAIERGFQPQAYEAALGEPVRTSDGRTYTVTAVEDFKGELVTDRNVDERYAELGQWIVVDMTLNNGGPNQVTVLHAHDFELIDSGGRRYSVSTSPGAAAYSAQQEYYQGWNWIPLGSQVPFGAIVRTSLVFDVARDATGLKLDVKPTGVIVDLERPRRIPINELPRKLD